VALPIATRVPQLWRGLTRALTAQVSRAAKAVKREDEIVYGVSGCTNVLEVWLMDKPEE